MELDSNSVQAITRTCLQCHTVNCFPLWNADTILLHLQINIGDLLAAPGAMASAAPLAATATAAGPSRATAPTAPTADEIRAALRSAEDEADATAAATAEQEVAAEMEEFTAEPAPAVEAGAEEDADGDEAEEGDNGGTNGGEKAPAGRALALPSAPSPVDGVSVAAAAELAKEEEEAEAKLMADMAKLQQGEGGAQVGVLCLCRNVMAKLYSLIALPVCYASIAVLRQVWHASLKQLSHHVETYWMQHLPLCSPHAHHFLPAHV